MSWSEITRIGIVQPDLVVGEVERNLEETLDLMEECVERSGPRIIIAPEAFTTGFPFEDLDELSSTSKMVLDRTGTICRRDSVHAIFTLIIKDEEGMLRNRLFHIDDRGNVKFSYDKTHLFSRTGEEKYVSPGHRLKTFHIDSMKVGPLICYELRYPSLSEKLALSGVHILVYPSLWPDFRIYQWETLLKARAIENQLFVVGVNSVGKHGDVRTGGSSRIVSPYGRILAKCGKDAGWITAELDPGEMWKLRDKIPVARDRREINLI